MMRQPVSTRSALLVGLAGGSAVLLGAFGAHALHATLRAHTDGIELWRTAMSYHLWHALALVLAVALGRGRNARIASFTFVLGIVLFSGSLYALALGAPRWTGIITPFGGLAFIVGWVALGLSLRSRD